MLCVCEGFATGASIYEATRYPVAVAFNAGNLKPVAKALRRKWPNLPIILCADNDLDTEAKGKDNPGRTKANEAAEAVGGLVVIPDFGPNRPQGDTDFNDLHRAQGLNVVKQQIESVIKAAGIEQSDPARPDDPPAPATFPPSGDERPCCRVLDDWLKTDTRSYRPGVYFCGLKRNKDETTTLDEAWFCSPLHTDAITHDKQENNFGLLLRFKNTLGNWRKWAMPMELLSGRANGEKLRAELLKMGVDLDPDKAPQQLPRYFLWNKPKRKMLCVLQTGWVETNTFVLPNAVIGPGAPNVTFQSVARGHDEYTTAGTLDGWREEIAARAIGNPLLILALSAGFAGPLLHLVHGESGGLHFFGDSSTGKSAIVEAACSIWGSPEYKRSWRATANGMEGAAALFSDSLLALDEISECAPSEVGKIIYALGNGLGKQRASRSGAARRITRWRCVVLSSGERTVETSIHAGGGKIKAGQSVRLIDIPVTRCNGVWDNLHGLPNGAALSDSIKQATKSHYGFIGCDFMERLTNDKRNWCETLEKGKAILDTGGDEGQVKRAVERFAIYAIAGELATEYGLTGWPDEEAFDAAEEGLRLWLSERGHGNNEKRQIIEQVSNFIDKYGDARFSSLRESPENRASIRERAGWWNTENGNRIYLFHPQGMREALIDFDFNSALAVLNNAGVLKPGTDGKRSQLATPTGDKKTRVYHIDSDKLAEVHHVP